MIHSQTIALRCARELRGGQYSIGFSTLIMREWKVTPRMIRRMGVETVLETPEDMRGVRFGWKRRADNE